MSAPGARQASAAGQPGDPASAPDRDRLPAVLLAYSTALAVLLLVPPYLAASVGPPEAFTLQEAIDLFTPLVVIPLAWLAFDLAGGLGRPGLVAFLVLAAAWVEGQGIHLAANAVGDAFTHDAADAFYRTVPGELNLWLDETLSHWLWHIAWVGLDVLLLAAATRGGAVDRDRASLAAGVAGAIHGAVFFVVTVEGVTALLGLPASLLLFAWSAVAARRGLARHPVITFFLVSTAVTLLGYFAWAAANDWTLPEFSKAGLFG